MNIPGWIKPAAYGAVAGGTAVAVVGFTWGGWVTAGSADARVLAANNTGRTDLAAAICVQNFLADDGARDNLAEIKQFASSSQQRTFIEAGGWAVMPDSEAVARPTATLCARMLSGLDPIELPVVQGGEVVEEGAVIEGDAAPAANAPAAAPSAMEAPSQ